MPIIRAISRAKVNSEQHKSFPALRGFEGLGNSPSHQCSTRIREFNECIPLNASLFGKEPDANSSANSVKGEFAMLMKLGLATTVAALSIAAITSAGATINPTPADAILRPPG